MSGLTPGRFARSGFWVTLAWMLLELAIWLVLPKVLDAAFPDVEERTGWPRIAHWVLTLVWAVWMGALFILWLSRSRRIRRLLGEDQTGPGPLAEALQVLEHRFEQAEDALHKLGPLPGGRPRSRLLMIGPRGAGKSAAVRGSELSVFVLDARNSPFEVAPSQSCDWLHCGDAVVLDTAGRYTSDPQGREEWLGLLKLLARRQGGDALDAVILAVNLPELMSVDSASARLLGERLRRQLDDLVEVLGHTPPAHLLLTHTDSLEGFNEFFRRVPSAHERVWGHGFPAAAQASPDLVADFNKGFAALARALEGLHGPVLASEQDPEATRRAMLFPAQVSACRARLADLIKSLTGPTGLPNRIPLVAFWLTSARAQGSRLNLIGAPLDAALGLHRSPSVGEQPVSGHTRPYFLKPLFASVLTTPSAARLLAEGERSRRRRVRRWIYAAALLTVTLGGGGVLWFGIANLQTLAMAEAQITGLQRGLQRGGALVDPESLARALVLADLVFDEPPVGDAPASLATWAYTRAGAERPGWWRRTWTGTAQGGLESSTYGLLQSLARRRVIEPAANLLTRELEVLNAAEVPGLATRPEGAPLAQDARDWATRAWTATALAESWRQLAPEDGGDATLTPEALAEASARTAASIGSLLERMRRVDSAGSDAAGDGPRSADVESRLALLWLTGAPQSAPTGIALPASGLVRSVRGRLAPVSAADLLYSVSLEETSQPGPLELQSTFLRWSSAGRPIEGPHGFTARNCQEFEARLEEHLRLGTFAEFKSSQGQQAETIARAARESYDIGYLQQWSFWIESIQVPSSPSGGSTLDQLPDQIERIYRGGDGDLELLLMGAGRGAPPPPTPEGAESTPAPLPQRCACQMEAWWVATALARPDGALHKNLADLQAAMSDLARAIEALPQDAGARQALVRDTFAQKGVLISAVRANTDLLRAIESARAPQTTCTAPAGDNARRQQISNLIEEVGLRVFNQIWWHLLVDYQQQANRAWQEEISASWARMAHQFPLDARSTVDADAADIKALLGTSGTLDKATETWLTPLLDQGVPRAPLWQPAPHLQLSDGALQMVRNRGQVTRVVDQIDGTWDINFRCLKQDNYRINRLQVTQEGQPILTCDFEYNKESMTLSVSPSTRLVFLASLQGQALGGCLEERPSGEWALYRALLRGLGTSSRRPGELSYTGPGCTAKWGYEEGRDGPFGTFSVVSRLGLPDPILVLTPTP